MIERATVNVIACRYLKSSVGRAAHAQGQGVGAMDLLSAGNVPFHWVGVVGMFDLLKEAYKLLA